MRRPAWIAVAAIALCAGAAGADPATDAAGVRLASLDNTIGLLDKKIADHRDHVRALVDGHYREVRRAAPTLIADPESRARRMRRRSLVRRMIRREMHFLGAVEGERDRVVTAKRATQQAFAARAAPPRARSLLRPIPGAIITQSFGTYRGMRTRTQLTTRGIELAAARGQTVRAVAAGKVIYVGSLGHYGQGVIIDHGTFTSITARLTPADLRTGTPIAAGATIGHPTSPEIHLEIRLHTGPERLPINPVPLLAQ